MRNAGEILPPVTDSPGVGGHGGQRLRHIQRPFIILHVLCCRIRDFQRAERLVGSEFDGIRPLVLGFRTAKTSGPHADFRQPRAAAELLETPHAVETLKAWLEHNARVETLNGFPYGNFHGQRVKEHVFQPDWTTPERFEYTCNLFRILARIGDENADRLTVSTLPASHSWFHAEEERMFSRLDAMRGFLDVLSRQTGRLMQLGLEPEPFGHFHDTEGAIRFFNGLRNHSRRPELIERHLGLISLCKVQFSNALECRIRGEEDLERLRQFDDGVYFHQTSILHRGRTMLFPGPAERPGLRAGLRGRNAGIPNGAFIYHIPLYASRNALGARRISS